MPKVSIITACHNDDRFIGQCCSSVRAQTYKDFEHIIVVTGSATTPDNPDMPTYRIPDPGGLSSTRNYGIERATGEYIAALDADDWIHPQFLEKLIAHAAPDVVVCPGMQEFGNRSNAGWPTSNLAYDDFKRGNRIFVSSMYARSAWERVGGYDVYLDQRGCEDWCLWCDLMKIGCRIVVVPELMFYYRVHSTSLMMTKGVCDDAVNYLRAKHP